jgi:2'-5' RNA ligase
MYGIIAYLDQESEEYINELRRYLKKAGISDYGMKPHVTIATHQELDLETFKEQLKQYFNNETQVPLFFPSIGIFLNSGTLFAAPTKDPLLTEFHNRYHKHFKEVVNPESLYAPAQWVPHCTIASHLTHEKLLEAFDWSSKKIEPFKAKIESIALIEVDFDGDNPTDVHAFTKDDQRKLTY